MNIIKLIKKGNSLNSPRYNYKEFPYINKLMESGYKFPIFGKLFNDDLGLMDVLVELNYEYYKIDYDISFDPEIVLTEIQNSSICFEDVINITNKIPMTYDGLWKFTSDKNLEVLWNDKEDTEVDNTEELNFLYDLFEMNTMYEIEQTLIDNKFYIGKIENKGMFISTKELLKNIDIYDQIGLSVARFIDSIR